MQFSTLLRKSATAAAMLLVFLTGKTAYGQESSVDVPIFITIGQSNADGSAMYDDALDQALNQWYTSSANTGKMKMWYRSTYVENQSSNALGEAARWAKDGTTVDVEPGWLNLWYRNENTAGRTAMNMIHGYGTWSTGSDTDCAQGRRGMEGAFGKAFATGLPQSELYMLKLGVSGSFISSWANPLDDTNWTYFYDKIFKPAIEDLLAQGKRPRLAGIWWMQGCADRDNTQSYYEESLRRLAERVNSKLGFPEGKIYVGHIIKPGESTVTPSGSVQYGQSVRDAQDAVAASLANVEIVDTKDFPLQYESSFSGYLHFNHQGVNEIGEELARRVIDAGADSWVAFTTPGTWIENAGEATFVPAFGTPDISYSTSGDVVTATIAYPGFTDVKTYTLTGIDTPQYAGPGYLDCDGTRYMRIPNHTDFDIPAEGGVSISFDINVPAWASSGSYFGLVCNNFRNTSLRRSGFDIFMGSSSSQTIANNFSLTPGSGDGYNIGGAYVTSGYTPGNWAHIVWVYDGDYSKIYINGTLMRNAARSDKTSTKYPAPSQGDILVGARWVLNNTATTDISYKLVGQMKNLRFYKAALSASEVAADADGAVSGKELIAAYDFLAIDGLTMKDISGNGHDAELVGFPAYSTGATITIQQANGGTITLQSNGTEIISGSRVDAGQTVDVVVNTVEGYTLDYVTVNGQRIEGTSFTMPAEDVTVSAVYSHDSSAPTKILLWDMGDDGSRYYRIPALATAADGSIIAICDKRGNSNSDLPNTISVVCKRSTDGGETWSDAVTIAEGNASTGKTYGDAAVVLDRTTGNLVCVYSGDNGFWYNTNLSGFYVSISEDNGQTWSAPRSISSQIRQSSWYGAFAASGSLLQTQDGTLMFCANTRLSSVQYVQDVYEFVCASTDGGQTWSVINSSARVPENGIGNESKLVELPSGELIMSIRSSGKRRFSRSTDGGSTWSAATAVNDLVEPDCNGDIILYPSQDGVTRLLHSIPNNASSRRDVAVFMSTDEGYTWPIKKQLVDAEAAYSSLTVLDDGSIGCLIEEGNNDGFRIYFMRFTLDWLTDGADNGDTGNKVVSPGYLDCDGTRYMYIDHSSDFDIPVGGQMTVTARVSLDEYGTARGVVNNRWHSSTASSQGNGSTTGFDIFGGETATNSFSNNVNLNKGSWNNIGHTYQTGLATQTWANIAWVFDGTTGTSKLYLNGVLKETKTSTDMRNYAINPQTDMLVGARYNTSAYPCAVHPDWCWLGKIDDVRFYSTALTDQEVQAAIDSEVDSSTPNLIAAYDFTDIQGDKVTDISGNGHTGTLVGFPEYGVEGVTVTIAPVDASKGTVMVWNGDTQVYSGRKVDVGTELTIQATPAEGYLLKEISVNGVALEEGVTTITVEEATTIVVVFEWDMSNGPEYVTPSGDGLSDTNCYVELAETLGAAVDIAIERSQKNGENYEFCDEQTIMVRPGTEFTLHLQAKKTNTSTTTQPSPQDLRYCMAYIFTDWDGDGTFEACAPTGVFASNGRYGYYYLESGFPNITKANYDYVMDIRHTFQVPLTAEIGKSRIRVIYTEAWDKNYQNVDGNYQNINKGYAYDYAVEVLGVTAIDGIETDADSIMPIEYFNLQGIKVKAENLAPGFYIRRQGSKAEKVFVK